jgi:tetratricopeptide (TPR) repeat protein
VGGALLQGDEGKAAETAQPATQAPPPLDLGVLPGDAHARALIAAENAYARGKPDQARRGFEAVLARDEGSVEAAVGAALSTWPAGTLQRLRNVVAREPGSALARVYLGVAEAAAGDDAAAKRAWREAVEREPDSPGAVQADSLLHPQIAPGLPPFVPSGTPPSGLERRGAPGELRALRARAENGDAEDWLELGAFYQQVLKRPVSARRAYDRALALEPESLDAQVAAAVGRFAKDDPSAAFARLGPLAKSHPGAGIVRFHLGVMLLWIRAVDEAKRQLTLAVKRDPGSKYAAEARKLLETLPQS